MLETIKSLLVWVAPLVAGFITTVLIPMLIKKFATKTLQDKIEEVNSGSEFKEVKKELAEIKKEILEMRGKRK